jgi:hypothetical protein
MTDYYQLMTRAIASLDTGESRRALYGRARDALVESLRNLDPRLSESEITRERLSLEQAIRDVETDAMRRLSVETQQPRPVTKSGLEQGRWDEKPAPDGARLAAPGQEPVLAMPLPEPESQPVASADADPEAKGDGTSARQRRARAAADAQDLDRLRVLLDQAVRCAESDPEALRSEAESAGRWPAHVRDGSRELEAVPEPSRTARRVGFEPRRLRMPRPKGAPPVSRPHPRPSAPESLGARQAGPEAAATAPQRRSKKRLISAFLSVLIVLALALTLYWLRDPLKAIFIKQAAPLEQQSFGQLDLDGAPQSFFQQSYEFIMISMEYRRPQWSNSERFAAR